MQVVKARLSLRRSQIGSRHSRQQGFSLIEILIALLVLAVGFLGSASLQSVGVKQTQNTYFRTQADLVARDLADRMRSNPLGARANDYVWAGGTPALTSCYAGANCDASTMAAADLSEAFAWMQRAALPSGDFMIAAGPAGAPYFQITVLWDERRDGSVGRNCNPADSADMTCLIVNVDADDVSQINR